MLKQERWILNKVHKATLRLEYEPWYFPYHVQTNGVIYDQLLFSIEYNRNYYQIFWYYHINHCHFFPDFFVSCNSIHMYPGFIIFLTVFQWWGLIKENKIVACCSICSNVFSIRLYTLTFQGQKIISIEISFRFICAWVFFFTVMQTFLIPCSNFLIFLSNVTFVEYLSCSFIQHRKKMYLQFLF